MLWLLSRSSNENTSKPPTTADLYYSWDEKATAKQENRKKSTVLQHGLTATAVDTFFVSCYGGLLQSVEADRLGGDCVGVAVAKPTNHKLTDACWLRLGHQII